MKKVKSVFFNAHQCGNNENGFDLDGDYLEIGKAERTTRRVVKSINEHEPSGGLERHFVVVEYENGESKKIFNMEEINYYSVHLTTPIP